MQMDPNTRQPSAKNNPFIGALLKLWHLPDGFHWMAPLPYAHRRGVLLALFLMLIAFFWPANKPDLSSSSDVSTPIDLSASDRGETASAPTIAPAALHEADTDAERVDLTPTSPSITTAAEPPTQTIETTPVITASQQTPAAPSPREQWKEFAIEEGQTLSQLFMKNNFIVNDAFLLANVEGPGKPVNVLRVGQKIRVRLTDENQLTALEVELSPHRSALFTRQSDGRFIRVH